MADRKPVEKHSSETARKGHRSKDELMRVFAAARCVLWYGTVDTSGGRPFVWRVRIPDEEAAQEFLPLDVPPGGNYFDAMTASRSVFPGQQERLDAHGEEAIAQKRPRYQQEYCCRARDGSVRWLFEDVYVDYVKVYSK